MCQFLLNGNVISTFCNWQGNISKLLNNTSIDLLVPVFFLSCNISSLVWQFFDNFSLHMIINNNENEVHVAMNSERVVLVRPEFFFNRKLDCLCYIWCCQKWKQTRYFLLMQFYFEWYYDELCNIKEIFSWLIILYAKKRRGFKLPIVWTILDVAC